MHSRRFLTLALIVMCVIVAEVKARSYRGQAFPDFTATDALTGRKFSLGDLRGKVVLVDFWATWCRPCVNELPNVTRLHDRFHDDGLEIVSISLDSDKQRFERFARSKRMTWHQVMEGGGWQTRLAVKFGIRLIPQMYVLDPAGVCIAENVRGGQLEEAVRRGLEMVERGGAAPQPEPPDPDPEPRRRARPSDPAPAEPVELVALRGQLAVAAGPLEQLEKRLDTLAAALDDLQRQLPAPRDPATARRQLATALAGLSDARHAAFVMGLLDGLDAAAVPANPVESDPDDLRSWAQAIETLRSARGALDYIRAAAGEAAARLSLIKTEIGDLERQLARGDAAEGSIEGIEKRIGAFAGDLDDPWSGQVETARRIIAGQSAPFDQAQAMLDGIDARLAALGPMLAATPRDTESLRALQSGFGSVRDNLAAVMASIDAEGRAVAALPADPFEGRRLRDRRILDDMAVQVDLAAEDVAALRALAAERRERLNGLIDRLVSLGQELSDRLAAGDPADETREQFEAVTREVLALRDGLLR